MKSIIKIAALALVLTGFNIGMVQASEAAMAKGADSVVNPKIAVVNIAAVLQSLPSKDQPQEVMRTKFAKRQDELKGLSTQLQSQLVKQKKDAAFMGDAEKLKLSRAITELKSQFDLKRQLLQQDEQQTFANLRGKLMARIEQAVKIVAEKNKFDLVLPAPAVAFAQKSLDITQQVAEQMSKSH